LGFWQVTVSGVGIVIGAGIYVLIGPATADAGNAVWLAFVMAALLAALTGLSYAELAGMFPSAGAEYAFARHAFNEMTGFLVGWMMVSGNVIAAAAVAIGFSHYARHFVDVDVRLIAPGLIVALTVIIAGGIQRSIWLTVALVFLQVGGLVLVIIAGAPHFGDVSLLEGATVSGVMGAAALVFFAFIGFDEIVTLSEETHDAARVIPAALLAALGVSTALYVLVAVAAVSVAGADAIAASDTPLALVIGHNWGSKAEDIVAVIALASTTNTSLLVLTAASRLLYGMSRSGSMPPALSLVNPRTHAPWVGAIAAGAMAIVFTLIGDLGRVAAATDFAVYSIFIVVNAALITLRYRMPNAERTFTTPIAVGRIPVLPIIGGVTAVIMMTQLEWQSWLIGAFVLACGLGFWGLQRPGAPEAQ
jgi:APA family basic amino acid/polyamine antiporter